MDFGVGEGVSAVLLRNLENVPRFLAAERMMSIRIDPEFRIL
jgi:hypothetical protein